MWSAERRVVRERHMTNATFNIYGRGFFVRRLGLSMRMTCMPRALHMMALIGAYQPQVLAGAEARA